MKLSTKLLTLIFLMPLLSIGQNLPDTLRVGIIKYKTKEKLLATYTPMIEYLGKEIGLPTKLVIVDDDKLGYELAQGIHHIGIFKPFPYLQSKVDFPELEVFSSHLVKNNEYSEGVILTKKESNTTKLTQLKDKRFFFIKPTSTSGYRYPKGVFKEYNIDIDQNFFSFDFSYDHNEALDALIQDQVDGIAVSLDAVLARDNISINDFNVLSEYKVPHHAYVFSPSFDSLAQESVKSIMFSAHKTPEGRELFQNPLDIDKWIEQDDDYYNYLRRYLRIMRVKPSIQVNLDLKESAKSHLSSKGDLIDIIKDNLYNELLATHRFSNKSSKASSDNQVSVTLSMIKDDEFHYQIYLNSVRIADSHIKEELLVTELPRILAASVLIHDPMTTDLLSNDDNSFITFGKNDGLNLKNYTFVAVSDDGAEEELEVINMSDLNTAFSATDLPLGTKVVANYMTDEIAASQVSVMEQIDTDDFWRDNFWDKLGLIVGVLLAIASGFIGWIFNSRKKKRFQNMLTETNILLKSYYEDKIKLDQRLDELKDTISNEMEKGNITENQFLILKHKLDEVEQNVRDNKMNKTESNEQISEILKDSGIDAHSGDN